MDVPDRQSFVIYKNFYEPIKHLSNTDLGKLFRAIFEYQITNGVEVEPGIKIPFEFFKNQFKLDDEKWMKRVEASRANGLLGGRPPEPREPSGFPGLDEEPRKGDTVTVTVTDTENDNETEKDLKEIQKKDFETWWINWRAKARDNPGVKNKAEKHWKVLNKKLSAEQIQKATDLHFKASGKFHKAAERFLNPADGLVMQLLEEPPPPAVPQQQPRIPATQTVGQGTIDTFKMILANMNAEAAINLWESKGKLFREHPKLQQIYHNKLKEETHDPEILQQQGSI